MTAESLRSQILELVKEYYRASCCPPPFNPGRSTVPVSGKVFDSEEMANLVDAALDFWLTSGRYVESFEEAYADYIGVKHVSLCNSGSSANLLALSALTSQELGRRRLYPGDEVITVAAGFPTTVNPIIQANLVPVFLDVEVGTYNIQASCLEQAIGPRTKAVMLAHALGNPFNLEAVLDLCERHNLWLIEDNCDALGSRYQERLTGTFGDLSTASFYPAHHITMGEGGAVLTNSQELHRLVVSYRDWGRACWCAPGKDNTCGKRFDWQLGDLPYGYDHKYTYSHIGYNLKLTDMQAAVGVAQLKKLPAFVNARKRNWNLLYEGLKPFEEFLVLPYATPGSDPSWFGFAVTVRPRAPFRRSDIVHYLEEKGIGTRPFFGGNLARQPAYKEVEFRTPGGLANADVVMHNAFWVGVYPGLTDEMIDFILEVFTEYFKSINMRGEACLFSSS